MALPTGTNYGLSVTKYAVGSTAVDLASIADGDEEAVEVTVTGAQLGDFVLASHSLDVTDLTVTGSVTAANTVTVIVANNTGGAIDIAAGTVYAMVIPREVI
jgi:hypothetical protein